MLWLHEIEISCTGKLFITGPGGVLLLLQALERRLMGTTPKTSMSRASSVISVDRHVFKMQCVTEIFGIRLIVNINHVKCIFQPSRLVGGPFISNHQRGQSVRFCGLWPRRHEAQDKFFRKQGKYFFADYKFKLVGFA